jgi:hypothetical protein
MRQTGRPKTDWDKNGPGGEMPSNTLDTKEATTIQFV